MTDIIHTETIERDGMTFRVEHVADTDHGAPWENEDGHGPVSYANRGAFGYPRKRPGELQLTSNHGSGGHVYDFAAACRIALRDGWGSSWIKERHEQLGWAPPTAKQVAAAAAREDYERLRAWCNDEWSYIGVVVTLLDIEGNETDATDSLWGVDDDGSYAATVASDCVDNIISETRDRMSYADREIAQTIYSSGSRSWTVSEGEQA